MNAHAQEVIFYWTQKSNLLTLWNATLAQFKNNPKVRLFMRERFAPHANTYAGLIARELRLSTPLPGVSIAHQVAAFNRQFLRIFSGFIVSHVLGESCSGAAPGFVVGDGLPTSRFGAGHHNNKDANCILATWSTVATPPVQSRDDAAGGTGLGSTYDGIHRRVLPDGSTQLEAPLITGVTFCDQSALGNNHHVSALIDDPSIVALNRDSPAWTNVSFGTATPESDARLMSRRIFRNNEEGVENGVRMGEVRLQRRAIDRDITETLRATGEMDGQSRGYDMTSLYCRVDNKMAARAFYEPQSAPRQFLYDTN